MKKQNNKQEKGTREIKNISLIELIKRLRIAQAIKDEEINAILDEIQNDSFIKTIFGINNYVLKYEFFEKEGYVRIAFCKPTTVCSSLSDETNDDNIYSPTSNIENICFVDYINGVGTRYRKNDNIARIIAIEKKDLLRELCETLMKYSYLNNKTWYEIYYGKENPIKLSIYLNGNIKFDSLGCEEATEVLKRIRIPKDDLKASRSFSAALDLSKSSK